jgi:aminopeptidase N
MKKFFKWLAISVSVLVVLLLLAGFVTNWYYNNFESEYPSGGLLSENQHNYDVFFYNINLQVFLDEKAIKGYTVIKLRILENDIDHIELDLIDTYNIDSVIIKGQDIEYQHQLNKLLVYPAKPFFKSQVIDVKVSYKGKPPEAKYPPWLGGFTWSEDDSGYAWIGLSCQGEGAKIWFPCKDHPSDEPDSAAINITVPDEYFVAANGLLKKTTIPAGGLVTYHWLTLYPINNYLINFGIGKFLKVKDVYESTDGTNIPVVFYVLPQLEKGARPFVEEAINTTKSFEKYFGPYPWENEKIGFLNTPFSGMEHQTLIAYGNKYRETQIDGFTFDPLLVHELAHEWWGNKVTVHDWADFWIHEGFATYAEALWVLDNAGEDAYHHYMNRLKDRIVNYMPLILGTNLTSNESYQTDIYNKGAAFVHTLRYVLQDSLFFMTLKEFATDSVFVYKNLVDTENFIDLIEKNSGQDLTALFELYLKTNNYPDIKVDSVAQNTYAVSIPNIDFEIPMDVSYNNKTERIMLGPEKVIIISSEVPIIDEKDWYLKEEND